MSLEPELLRVMRSTRLQTALGASMLGAGVVVLLLRSDIDTLVFGNLFDYPSRTSLFVGLSLLTYGAAFLMLQYLRGGILGRKEGSAVGELPDSVAVAAVSVLREKVGNLTGEVALLKSAQLDALGGSRQELIDALKPTLHAGVADELEQRFTQRVSQSVREREIREVFAAAESRLRGELGALGRRSNLNLVIGVLTTSMAVGLLTYMVLGVATTFDSITALLSHYVPRLALVLFIEVFSFFFLRLYRATLSEMRTYQTDLTTLTIQHVAVVAAFSTGDAQSVAIMSKELLTTKSTSSVDPASKKPMELEPKAVADMLQAIAKALPTKAKDA